MTTAKFAMTLPVLTDQKGTTISDLATNLQILDDHAASLEQAFEMAEVATPASPAAGYNSLYFKSDDKLYKKTSGGVESEIGAGQDGVVGPDGATGDNIVVFDSTTGKIVKDGGVAVAGLAAAAHTHADTRKATVLISGGDAVITTGVKAGFECPITGHITAARLESLDATSGAIAVAVWIEDYAGGVPVDADEVDIFSIAASGTQSEETGLTIDVTAGDWISFNVDSVTSLKLVALGLTIEAA